MKNTVTRCLVLGVLLLSARAGVWAQQEDFKAPALRIYAGDLIELTMFESPDLSVHVRVNENGDIRIPLAGVVHVAGDTADEAAAAVEKRYIDAKILKPTSAHATVVVSELSQRVTVAGDVRSPGFVPIVGIRTLHEVLVASGGVLPSASTEVQIARRGDFEHPIKVLYDPLAHVPVIPAVQIYPGDTITVPRAGIVYVVGSVNRATSILIEGHDPLTAIKAVAMSSPDKRVSKLSKVVLVRSDASGNRTQTILDMKKINSGELPDVAMKDGDILYVPHSLKGEIGPQAISLILSMVSSATLYRLVYNN